MDRFRYMVHNGPSKYERSEPSEPSDMEHVEFVLTQSDVQYFFLSADVYPEQYRMKKPSSNEGKYRTLRHRTNYTKTRNGEEMPVFQCDQILSSESQKTLELMKPRINDNVVFAWPTLKDAVGYYQ